MNFYNENDPKAAAWLRELIKAGLIPDGHVDERSIKEVQPRDLEGFTQVHLFAGIAGWSLALELAGWPEDRPVWTGSCPCQPFSAAGKRNGVNDERHLWPEMRRLIEACEPGAIFGEQVYSKDGKKWFGGGHFEVASSETGNGTEATVSAVWNPGVRADLEALGYGVGCADLCSPCAGEEAEGWIVRGGEASWERIVCGAPHIRQRLFWVADAAEARRAGRQDGGTNCGYAGERARCVEPQRSVPVGGMGNTAVESREREPGGVPEAEAEGERERSSDGRLSVRPQYAGAGLGGLGDTNGERFSRRKKRDEQQKAELQASRRANPLRSNAWSNFQIVHCRDGKSRRFEPGSFPLADGVPGRVGLLRVFGNAIVPELAAEFVMAFLEAR